ncbi:MAG: NAD(P)-dependent alcohol dehydrogenase [Nitrososphaerota archaeon]|nr:NAD(P)-dependent alcohol dehydrogenase [Candidatus Bathyarchaeota archaeon]MDW8022715.1 NAD(P)-dependent alcohol dehydrogenase [Nitrososphaerota archaeon]
MKAMRLHEYKQPLRMDEVEVSKPGPKEALVKIEACGVCHTDLHFAEGALTTEMFGGKRPWTLGHEIAGKIVEVGSEVTDFKTGDRVLIDSWTAYSCGSCIMCRTGVENCCLYISPIGFARDGGYAEYIKVPAKSLIPIGNLKPEDVAPLACGGVTSFRSIRKAGVTPSDTVVVYGAGGLGTFAVQIAKAIGATVIAVSRSKEKLEMAKKFGADYTVDASKDPVGEVLKITGGRGANVVLDFVGFEQTLEHGLKMLGVLGRLLIIGVGPSPLKCMPNDAVNYELTITGVKVGTHKDLLDVVALAKGGIVKPITTKVFKLGEVNEAFEQLKKGQILGRCVIKP